MPALEKVKESIGSLVGSVDEVSPRRLVARGEPKDLKPIFQKLLEDFKQDFYLDFLAVVDYPDEKQIEANYNLWIYSLKTILTVKFRLPRDNPTIDTISDLIPSAVFHEQEAYDLMGVSFSGNPDLRRGFLVAEEAQGSFPLRKEEAKQT
jgi:NADH:ubiquinone oxidoreductase subunit C